MNQLRVDALIYTLKLSNNQLKIGYVPATKLHKLFDVVASRSLEEILIVKEFLEAPCAYSDKVGSQPRWLNLCWFNFPQSTLLSMRDRDTFISEYTLYRKDRIYFTLDEVDGIRDLSQLEIHNAEAFPYAKSDVSVEIYSPRKFIVYGQDRTIVATSGIRNPFEVITKSKYEPFDINDLLSKPGCYKDGNLSSFIPTMNLSRIAADDELYTKLQGLSNNESFFSGKA